MLRGKTLQDGTLLQEYNLKEGDKLNLVVKKEASPAVAPAEQSPVAPPHHQHQTSSVIETQTEILPRELLTREMTRLLKQHYKSDSEVRRLVSAFVKNIEKKLNNLSLDDIERICERWSRDQVIQL